VSEKAVYDHIASLFFKFEIIFVLFCVVK